MTLVLFVMSPDGSIVAIPSTCTRHHRLMPMPLSSSGRMVRRVAALTLLIPIANVAAQQRQLAFWINAYNAYTIEPITSHKERGSIRNINKSFGVVKAYGQWKERLARVPSAARPYAAKHTTLLGSTRSLKTRRSSFCSGHPRRIGSTWPPGPST